MMFLKNSPVILVVATKKAHEYKTTQHIFGRIQKFQTGVFKAKLWNKKLYILFYKKYVAPYQFPDWSKVSMYVTSICAYLKSWQHNLQTLLSCYLWILRSQIDLCFSSICTT